MNEQLVSRESFCVVNVKPFTTETLFASSHYNGGTSQLSTNGMSTSASIDFASITIRVFAIRTSPVYYSVQGYQETATLNNVEKREKPKNLSAIERRH
jgi:hypothetical protein